jgi:hypothetical protein
LYLNTEAWDTKMIFFTCQSYPDLSIIKQFSHTNKIK